MKRFSLALVVLLTIYIGFNLTIGVMITGKVRQFDESMSAKATGLGTNAISVDSSVCSLLAERDNWRGRLQALSFPWAARASNHILERYSFQVDSRSTGRMHCGKFNNALLARATR